MSLFPSALGHRDVVAVSADPRARYAAVQALLRPAEVDALFRPPTFSDILTPFPERVGAWMHRAFVAGALAYAVDPMGSDFWQSPAYTLRRGCGDCEDLSLLALSMFQHEAVPAVMVTGAYHGSGHAWVEGVDAVGGFLLEATTGYVTRGARPVGYVADSAFGGGFYRRLAA